MEKQSKARGYCACAALTCRNNQKTCKLSFFRFPKNLDRARKWAIACGRKDLLEKKNLYGSYRLCGAHFEDRMFLNDLRNRLQENVIPSIFAQLNSDTTSRKWQRKAGKNKKVEKMSLTFTEESSILPGKISRLEVEGTDILDPFYFEIAESSTELDSSSTYSDIFPMLLSLDSPQSSRMSPDIPNKKYANIMKQQRNEIAKLKQRVEQLEQEKNIDHIILEKIILMINKFCPKEVATFINEQLIDIQLEERGLYVQAQN